MSKRTKTILKQFTIAAALLLGSGASLAGGVETCLSSETRSEAKPCLENVYSQSMDISAKIWSNINKKKAIDTSSMSPNLREEYNGFVKACLKNKDRNFTSNKNPESFLRPAEICLSIATNVADHTNTPYDFDRASELISEARRSRKLDLKK